MPFCVFACLPGKKKTLQDAKDGYHWVVLAEGLSPKVTKFCVNLVVTDVWDPVKVSNAEVMPTHTGLIKSRKISQM